MLDEERCKKWMPTEIKMTRLKKKKKKEKNKERPQRPPFSETSKNKNPR